MDAVFRFDVKVQSWLPSFLGEIDWNGSLCIEPQGVMKGCMFCVCVFWFFWNVIYLFFSSCQGKVFFIIIITSNTELEFVIGLTKRNKNLICKNKNIQFEHTSRSVFLDIQKVVQLWAGRPFIFICFAFYCSCSWILQNLDVLCPSLYIAVC